MDTVSESKYKDTDNVYERPESPDIRVKSWDEDPIRTLRNRLESVEALV
jgi:adenylylsulfate kinase-like enzyme